MTPPEAPGYLPCPPRPTAQPGPRASVTILDTSPRTDVYSSLPRLGKTGWSRRGQRGPEYTRGRAKVAIWQATNEPARGQKEDTEGMEENFDRAMAVRRSVLGDEYVDAAVDNATPFTAPFQDFVTRWAWGEAWLDDTLDPQLRSLLTVAIVTVLGQLNEVRLHVRGALRNDCTPEEIGAVLKHVAVYAGVAKAVAGVGIANEEITKYATANASAPAASAQDGRR